jgi:hypothetical protein
MGCWFAGLLAGLLVAGRLFVVELTLLLRLLS